MTKTNLGLRTDAVRNRERIIVAAREVFAELGLEASTNEVARRAGVGIATVFRRFPSRSDLVSAVFEEKMHEYAAALSAALADADPWRGFCSFIEHACRMQAKDLGFADVLTLTFPDVETLEIEREQTSAALGELIERAKAAGRLRRDFVQQDVALILMANAGVVTAAGKAAPEAWQRLVGFLLQSLTVEASEPLAAPPTEDQMHRAMRRSAVQPGE